MAPLEQPQHIRKYNKTNTHKPKKSTSNHNQTTMVSKKPGYDRKTVAYAVNYEMSMVDRFLAASTSRKAGIETPTNKPKHAIVEDDEALVPSHPLNGSSNTDGRTNTSTGITSGAFGNAEVNGTKRRSAREKQRTVNLTPSKVRYDMDSVPLVNRPNLSFWDDVKVWPPRALKDPPPPIIPSSSIAVKRLPNAAPKFATPVPPPKTQDAGPLPGSVIWKPSTRKDWEDSVNEMTAVCTSAALRKHHGPASKFVPPLSKEYIRDRIDIDDPLRGYQLRHSTGGWLQGFCIWTNFTTWTHHFEWNSSDPMTGVTRCQNPKDADGSLASDMNKLPRSGSPTDGGIVFPAVAEIALLGGLGCGELMLRMAIENILKESQYKYIVLQATNSSRPFYERFGFVRVGALCKYVSNSTVTTETPAMNHENIDPSKTRPQSSKKGRPPLSTTVKPIATTTSLSIDEQPLQGYRHWTHHNESQHSLDLHGGPSYMMCLKLPEEPLEGLNLLEKLQSCFVDTKPSIDPIYNASSISPSSRRKVKRQTSVGSFEEATAGSVGVVPRPVLSNSTTTSRSSTPKANTSTPTMSSTSSSRKRRKVSMDRLDLGVSAVSAAMSVGLPPKLSTKTASTVKGNKIYSKPFSKNQEASSSSSSTSLPSSSRSRGALVSGTTGRNNDTTQVLRENVRPQAVPSKTIQAIDRCQLVKQRVKSYPRGRQHFYNKVVMENKAAKSKNSSPTYYFVLHYDDAKEVVTLCPLEARGTLSGKRAGRPRYQCVLEKTTKNWITAPSHLYTAVSAFMVMKTPLVLQEAWDIHADR